jgi:hypothetical protein
MANGYLFYAARVRWLRLRKKCGCEWANFFSSLLSLVLLLCSYWQCTRGCRRSEKAPLLSKSSYSLALWLTPTRWLACSTQTETVAMEVSSCLPSSPESTPHPPFPLPPSKELLPRVKAFHTVVRIDSFGFLSTKHKKQRSLPVHVALEEEHHTERHKQQHTTHAILSSFSPPASPPHPPTTVHKHTLTNTHKHKHKHFKHINT